MCKKISILIVLLFSTLSYADCFGQLDYEYDKFETSKGDLELCFIGHGTLMLKINDFVVHIDPVSREGNYNVLPDANLILVTHSHGDHLDPDAVKKITKSGTKIFCNPGSVDRLDNAHPIKNGEGYKFEAEGSLTIEIEAVPAYNIKQMRSPGKPYHQKGEGNGYIISIAGKRIYVAGDTEVIPEMKDFTDIDFAFLPMNLPYTMSPEMAAEAAKLIHPKVVYPYHFGSTDTGKLVNLLKESDIDLRIRNF